MLYVCIFLFNCIFTFVCVFCCNTCLVVLLLLNRSGYLSVLYGKRFTLFVRLKKIPYETYKSLLLFHHMHLMTVRPTLVSAFFYIKDLAMSA